MSVHRPPSQNNKFFLDIISDLLDFYSREHDNEFDRKVLNLKTKNLTEKTEILQGITEALKSDKKSLFH